MYSSAIIPKNLFERIGSSFFARSCLAISSINSFWCHYAYTYAAQAQDDFPYQDLLIEPGHSYPTVWKVVLDCHYRHYFSKLILGVLKNEYTTLLLSNTLFRQNAYIVQIIDHHFQYITTLRHYGFSVINKCFKSFLPIIKRLRDISFLHIMFCCQFPFMPYAKYTKNWVLFFGIVKPGKVLEPRGLTTAFFLSKLSNWKRIIRTRLTLYCNTFVVFICGFFLICVCSSWGLNIGFSSLRWRRC